MFYIQEGGVKLVVLSSAGKEAVIAMLGPGDFFGEGCLAGQPLRMGTAVAVVPTPVLVACRRSDMIAAAARAFGVLGPVHRPTC